MCAGWQFPGLACSDRVTVMDRGGNSSKPDSRWWFSSSPRCVSAQPWSGRASQLTSNRCMVRGTAHKHGIRTRHRLLWRGCAQRKLSSMEFPSSDPEVGNRLSSRLFDKTVRLTSRGTLPYSVRIVPLEGCAGYLLAGGLTKPDWA